MMAEVVTFPAMTEAEAERVTEQIAFRIDSITENYEVVMVLMRDALARNAHEALGYASPGAYIADRFGKSLQSLGASLRREFVHELSDAGLSTRAIAPVFDVSHMTIARDIESKAPVTPVTPEPVEKMRPDEVAALMSSGFVETVDELAEVVGLTVNTRTGEVIEPTVTEHTVTEKVKTTIGLDGKTYKRPEPKPIPNGDAANKINAIQAAKSIGSALETLLGMTYEKYRHGVVTDWWPLGKDEVPPSQSELFTPSQLRHIAQGLIDTANEMEALRV